MMSIRPQWVVKILNGKKTLEIRKKFPKDYVGWVYIYCCKQRNNEIGCHINYKKVDGKVVARFWCDNVEEIICRPICGEWECYTKTLGYSEIAKASCLENREIVHYLKGKNGKTIHITKLEIFDKPKEISEFKVIDYFIEQPRINGWVKQEIYKPLTKAPQSWCYVEE